MNSRPNLEITEAEILDLSDDEMANQVKDCDAVISCLGHLINLNGMFGNPRKLCTDATQRLCNAIEKNNSAKPTKFILMNTVGVQNLDLEENRAWFERGLLTLLHHALPPHRDNETAVEHLFRNIGSDNKCIEWCSVRPDSLINAPVSPYEITESPTTGLFSGRPTSRSNVAHFMTDLIESDDLWSTWKFRMPVIMDSLT